MWESLGEHALEQPQKPQKPRFGRRRHGSLALITPRRSGCMNFAPVGAFRVDRSLRFRVMSHRAVHR